jgi:hypothetical protein
MPITVNLPPETERQLHERATANGQTVERFISDLVLREVVAGGGSHSVSSPQRSSRMSEILEPVRREFDESGMSEDELVHFLTEVRDEVRKERGARKTP